MIPTKEEYENALEIVISYRDEENRLEEIRLKEFKIELTEYFLNNDILNIYEYNIEKNYFNSYYIHPKRPYFDECYGGELNEGIEKLCEKHNIKASIYSGYYGK